MFPNSIRIVVVVSTDPSDLYFANQVARRFRVAGILLEHQRDPPDGRSRWRKALGLLGRPRELFGRVKAFSAGRWHRWVSRNLLAEASADFGADGRRLDPAISAPVQRVEGKGKLNDPENVAWLRQQQPDLIVVCGASILKAPILEIPSRGVLNLHGGLSQFYRGLFTTDWAIHNNEPEKVGATVHFVSAGIDEGKVVFQARPVLGVADHPNKAYEKVVKLGIEMMSAAIGAIDAGRLHGPLEPASGVLYRERDFTDRVKRRLWRRWRKIMDEYDRTRASRDAPIDVQLLNPFPGAGRDTGTPRPGRTPETK